MGWAKGGMRGNVKIRQISPCRTRLESNSILSNRAFEPSEFDTRDRYVVVAILFSVLFFSKKSVKTALPDDGTRPGA